MDSPAQFFKARYYIASTVLSYIDALLYIFTKYVLFVITRSTSKL